MSDTPNGTEGGETDEATEFPDQDAVAAGTEGESQRVEDGELDGGHLRLLEAVLFSALEPETEDDLAKRLPDGADVKGLLAALAEHYENHGINLAHAGGRWFFRTAEDLSEQLRVHKTVPRRLSRAAMETLAIIAYHQPVTRAEIEEIRGVGLSRGTLDLLLEARWVAPKGRRRTAGRPVTWGTTTGFLVEFGIESINDLPGLDDLKAAGLLDKRPALQVDEFTASLDDEDETGGDDSPIEGPEKINIPGQINDGESSREEQHGIGSDNQDPTGSGGDDQNEGEKGLAENTNRE